jgi:hypothetical protein
MAVLQTFLSICSGTSRSLNLKNKLPVPHELEWKI